MNQTPNSIKWYGSQYPVWYHTGMGPRFISWASDSNSELCENQIKLGFQDHTHF